MKSKMKSDRESVVRDCMRNLKKRRKVFTLRSLKCELAEKQVFLSNQEIQAMLKKYVNNGELNVERGEMYKFS